MQEEVATSGGNARWSPDYQPAGTPISEDGIGLETVGTDCELITS